MVDKNVKGNFFFFFFGIKQIMIYGHQNSNDMNKWDTNVPELLLFSN